jgi:hypothetical protein
MKHTLSLNSKNISYTIRKHPRAKRMLLRVGDGGNLVVTAPPRMSHLFIKAMLHLNAEAIIQKIVQWEARIAAPGSTSRKGEREQYRLHKEKARLLAEERLVALNLRYGFTYKRISIRSQRTRWGSCSKKGNLNFNYKIALMPAHLVDYIIVHELCHLGAFDHSPKFWGLVAETIPNHKACRKELRSFRLTT